MSNCVQCGSEAAAGSRWCAVCHTSIVYPEVGRLASPGKRLGAYVLDLLVPGVALFLILFVAGAGFATQTGGGAALGSVVGVAMFAGYWLWAFVLFTRGTTPGKRLLGMRVVQENGTPAGFFTMLIREWPGKFISAAVLSMGFLWILLDRDNQGWHDKLASTYVVR